MNRTRVIIVLIALVFAASSLSAATITAAMSRGTDADSGEWNNYNNHNISFGTPGDTSWRGDPSWQALTDPVTLTNVPWISFDYTLCQGCYEGNVNLAHPDDVFYDPNSPTFSGFPYISFYQDFTVPDGIITGGYLTLLADDSVTVSFNYGTPNARQFTFTEPSSGPFNFEVHDTTNGLGLVVPLSSFAPALLPGTNTVRFDVLNLGSNNVGANQDGVSGLASFGLSYLLAFNAEPAPEPGSMALIALGGLALLGGRLYKKRA